MWVKFTRSCSLLLSGSRNQCLVDSGENQRQEPHQLHQHRTPDVCSWTQTLTPAWTSSNCVPPPPSQASARGSQNGTNCSGPGAVGERSQRVSSGWKRSAFRLTLIIYFSDLIWPVCSFTPHSSGYTPALACAPNRDVADCLALILNSMMPTSPMVTIAALPTLPLTQTLINHHPASNHISKGVAFDSPPALRPEHASYCRPERPLSSISADDELNDSDSETYWGLDRDL